jgi:hypothetical protein
MEATAEIVVLHILVTQDLDSHHSVQPVALGFIYNGHAAGTENLQDLVPVIQHLPDISIHS